MVEEAIYVYTITQRGTPSGDDDIVHGCPVTVLRITPSDPYLDKSKTIDMDQREYFFFVYYLLVTCTGYGFSNILMAFSCRATSSFP